MNVFKSNAAQIQDLDDAVHATFARRNEGDKRRKARNRKAWEEACLQFHLRYDNLAFPGGLGRAMSLLAKKDPGTIELVVQFLEADPWFFRSGYLKADMIKPLRQASLNGDQRNRLQQVIIARIQGQETPREFRWYCRLAPFVSDQSFEQQVAGFAEAAGSVQSRHALWVPGTD